MQQSQSSTDSDPSVNQCLVSVSNSGDLALNHSSALIGLNVELLVDWQAASVL